MAKNTAKKRTSNSAAAATTPRNGAKVKQRKGQRETVVLTRSKTTSQTPKKLSFSPTAPVEIGTTPNHPTAPSAKDHEGTPTVAPQENTEPTNQAHQPSPPTTAPEEIPQPDFPTIPATGRRLTPTDNQQDTLTDNRQDTSPETGTLTQPDNQVRPPETAQPPTQEDTGGGDTLPNQSATEPALDDTTAQPQEDASAITQDTLDNAPTDNTDSNNKSDSNPATTENPENPPEVPRPPETIRQQAETPTPMDTTEHTPIITKEDCRFNMQIDTKAADKPLAEFALAFKQVFKTIQEVLGKTTHLGAWDHEMSNTVPDLTSPSQFPTGKKKGDPSNVSNYISGYFRPLDGGGRNFIRIRLVNTKPDKYDIRNAGKLLNPELAILDIRTNIALSPIPCQAAATTCLGWLYGSSKTISELTFIPAIKAALKIPDKCAVGMQWRTMKNYLGKKPPYDAKNRNRHPMAVHIDIDERFAGIFQKRASALWRKAKRGHKRLPNDIQLRLVPCFGTSTGRGTSSAQRENMIAMAQKQLYLTNTAIQRFDTPFIAQLDTPLSPSNPITLRRTMMARAPKGAPTLRILHNVDPTWNRPSSTTITATQANFQMALDYANSLIPEIRHHYGAEADHWFTTEGLEIFQGIDWDPSTERTTSQTEAEANAMYEEDLWNIGDAWKTTDEAQRPTQSATPVDSTAGNNDNATTTSNKDNLATMPDDSDNKSFGSVFGRTVGSDTSERTEDAPTTKRNGMVTLDEEARTLLETPKDQTEIETRTMSTMGATNSRTRRKLAEARTDLKETKEALNAKDAQIAALQAMLARTALPQPTPTADTPMEVEGNSPPPDSAPPVTQDNPSSTQKTTTPDCRTSRLATLRDALEEMEQETDDEALIPSKMRNATKEVIDLIDASDQATDDKDLQQVETDSEPDADIDESNAGSSNLTDDDDDDLSRATDKIIQEIQYGTAYTRQPSEPSTGQADTDAHPLVTPQDRRPPGVQGVADGTSSSVGRGV